MPRPVTIATLPARFGTCGRIRVLDFGLSDEQQLIRETARAFCDREIAPFAREWDRSERMDPGIVAKLADVGFLGCALPEAYGGMGLDTVSYSLVMEELGRADSSV